MNKTNKLVFGVCGIGKGHTFRQLPIIEHYKYNSRIVIFAFGESYDYFSQKYINEDDIKVVKVYVPWIVGSIDGINFQETADKIENNENFIKMNFEAMNQVNLFLGNPDLIISDYEPISAQFSYIKGIKLITIDQQSKYFLKNKNFDEINRLSYKEEIARLNLFFPYSDLRIATSFFDLDNNGFYYGKKVKLLPSIIKNDIVNLKINFKQNQILIYISSYSNFVQSAIEVFGILEKIKNINFVIYAPKNSDFIKEGNTNINIKVYVHGDETFLDILSNSIGVISTAGHTFISEVMYLKIPMYLIPLGTYEQHFNAKIINDNKFGISSENINYDNLLFFINNIDLYENNIKNDKKILLKGLGQQKIIRILDKYLTH